MTQHYEGSCHCGAIRFSYDGEEITRAALSVGSCSAVALRLPAAEAFLAGKVLDRLAGAIEDELGACLGSY